jgi:hypothetical protein
MEIQKVERKPIVRFWHEKFGVPPETFDDYAFYKKGSKKVWSVRREAVELLDGNETIDAFDYESVGLPFLRVGGEHDKPTTDALQRFGDHARHNTVDLKTEEARIFVRGETIERDFDVEDLGYVIARYEGEVLGCGLYFPGELRSQVPKGRRVEVLL